MSFLHNPVKMKITSGSVSQLQPCKSDARGQHPERIQDSIYSVRRVKCWPPAFD